MKLRSPMLIGAAIALAMGLSLDFIRKDSSSAASPPEASSSAAMAESAIYYEPKLDGVSLDVRLMGHMRASPMRTAERFCRDQGYSTVADLTVRSSTATRTIADGQMHEARGHTNQAFAMIRCETHAAPMVAAG